MEYLHPGLISIGKISLTPPLCQSFGFLLNAMRQLFLSIKKTVPVAEEILGIIYSAFRVVFVFQRKKSITR